MPVPAVATDKDRQLAGLGHRPGHHPRRQPPDLHVVETKVASPDTLTEIVEQREDRDIRAGQVAHRLVQLLVVDRHGGDGIDPAAKLRHRGGEFLGRLRGDIADQRSDADIAAGCRRRLDLTREGLVEFMLLLDQKETQPQFGNLLDHAELKQAARVIADLVGGAGDLAQRFFPHGRPAVQRAIHCRDA